MGAESKLSIVSFNSSRKALQSLPQNGRRPYLENILDGAKPDICFLPGDDDGLKLNAVRGYSQYSVPTADGTVLLYDHSRVEMKTPAVSFNSFGPLPGLDLQKMVCPQVEVWSPAPSKHIVKEFSMVSWKYTMFSEPTTRLETLAESLLRFSQMLAMQSGRPVLIGGEMTLDYTSLTNIVNKLSKDGQQLYLSEVQPGMSEQNFLPSMTKSVSRDDRHLFMLKVFKCNSTVSNRTDRIVNTWNDGPVADCFIASKALELSEATLLNVEQVTGREIKMEAAKKYVPTHTSMEIPVRPPRHHGG